MRIGQLRDRVTFERSTSVGGRFGDGGGVSWLEVCTRNANVRFDRAAEKVEAAHLRETVTGRIVIRADSITKTLTNADRAVFEGANHQIRSVVNEDRRGRFLTIQFERGAVT